jgi:hypothetical protein
MIEVFGWICTAIILAGFVLNSYGKLYPALITWIIGDIGWIVYDLYIDNISHLALSMAIIGINMFGIFNLLKTKRDEDQRLDKH